MLQIIKQAEVKTEHAYRRLFRADYECHGFRCDDSGNPIFRSPREEMLFDKCLTKPDRYEDLGRVRREFTTHSPAIGRCECGSTLKLQKPWGKEHISCRCGRTYAADGTEVPRTETC